MGRFTTIPETQWSANARSLPQWSDSRLLQMHTFRSSDHTVRDYRVERFVLEQEVPMYPWRNSTL